MNNTSYNARPYSKTEIPEVQIDYRGLVKYPKGLSNQALY